MDEATFVVALLLWGVAPGWALTGALGSGWTGPERLAGAMGLSLALVAAAAYATMVVGLPMAPVPVAGLVLAICAAIRVTRRRRTRGDRPAAASMAHTDWCAAPSPRWLPWLVLLLPVMVVRQLEPLWGTGVLLPPTLFDGLDHANWFRLILETRSVDPSVVMAPPLNNDGSPTWYPWGMHAWLALVAGTNLIDPVATFSRGLVALSAAMPLSVYVFVSRFTGSGWPALAAAMLSLMFWWLPYQVWGWGGYALLAGAVAALPVIRLALDEVRRLRLTGLAVAAVAGVGVLLIHPSQAFAALLIGVVVTVTLAAGRAGAWRDAVPFLAGLALAGLVMTAGESASETIRAFMDKARTVAAMVPEDTRFGWPFVTYFEADRLLPVGGRIGLGVLYVVGSMVSLRSAALRPFVVLHVVFSFMIPLAARHSWLTSLWYHAPERLWYLQYASLPALGALGFAGLFGLAERVTRARWRLQVRQRWLWPVAMLGFMAVFHGGYAGWASGHLWRFGHRSEPMMLTDGRKLDDFRWIREHVPEGEVLLNASADWGIPLPFTGHRTVFWSGGPAIDLLTDWHRLEGLMNRGDPYTALAAREALSLGLHYVYAATVDPRLETGSRWSFRRDVLANSAALETLYESPTAAVFRIRNEGGERLGLTDSERIHFEGFWGVEQAGGRSWRWTNGDAQIRVRLPGDATGACFVSLLGPDPDVYQLRTENGPLELTSRGYRIAPVVVGATVELRILSPVIVPADLGGSLDDRQLGVQVFDVLMLCEG